MQIAPAVPETSFPLHHPIRRFLPRLLPHPLLPHLIPLAIALAVSQAHATTVFGKGGAPGAHATTPGASGGDGGAGESVAVVAGAADEDAIVYGGHGGDGGNGAAGTPGQNGGNGGAGGAGGSASASHIIRSAAAILAGRATATAGGGGRPGTPGAAGAGAADGIYGNDGDGAAAEAIVDIAGTGTISGISTATGGSSGFLNRSRAGDAAATTTIDGGSTGTVLARSYAYGGYGGPAGGNAAVAITASGHSLDLEARAYGGVAGNGRSGTATGTIRGSAGSGGIKAALSLDGGHNYGPENGTDVVSSNAFAVQTSGALALALEGTGGTTGNGAQPGHGGNADLALLLDDQHATSVTSAVSATGGNGGSLTQLGGAAGVAGNGGQAKAVLQVLARAPVTLTAAAIGGNGGTGDLGAAGNGGMAAANAIARASGSALASATATATGGAGGGASREGMRGGDGGAAQAYAAAYSDRGTARAISTTIGGEGGVAFATNNAPIGGNGGNGAAAMAINAVGGSTAGELVLQQVAQGGKGGGNAYTGGGAGGQGGAATSRLALIDSDAARIDTRLEARGGAGGYSRAGISGNGGDAEAVLELTSRKAGATIDATVYANGGVAGPVTSGSYGNGIARSTVSALGSVRNTAVVDTQWTGSQALYGKGNATAVARSDSTMNAHASASARTAIEAGTVAQARAESVSTGARGTAYADGQGGNIDVAALVHGAGATQNRASATGTGLAGTLQATSVTAAGAVRIETTVSTPVYSPLSVSVSAVTGILDTQQWHSFDHASYASYRPFMPGLFDLAPTVGAAFAQTTLVGAGSMTAIGINTVTAGLYHQVSTARFQFDTTAAGDLTLGLFDLYIQGAGFEELELTVSNRGVEILSHTFDTLGEAEAFFRDSVFSLGMFEAGSQDVFISADIAYATAWGATTFNYALGADSIAAVPEPGTWVMLLLGLSVVVLRQRRRT